MTSQRSPAYLSKQTLVLLHLSKHPTVTYGRIATLLGITERHAVRIVRDLEATGAITRTRTPTRVNSYSLNMRARSPDEKAGRVSARQLIDAFGPFVD